MRISSSPVASPTVEDAFFTPLRAAHADNPHTRRCPVISDEAWLLLGVRRVLESEPSGRGFLQYLSDSGQADIAVSTLFDNLSSERRLRGCRWTDAALRSQIDARRRDRDPLASYPCLSNFAIFAGDGHYHEKATHDVARYGHDAATQHFYALDLRTHTLRHVTAAETGIGTPAPATKSIRKREHDIRAIKRIGPEGMRMGVRTGTKVMHVWDRASIDLLLWARWKARHGIYFISRMKDRLALTKQGDFPYDRSDPINAGIESDEFMASGGGMPVRCVTYICPATKERFQFLTSDHTIPPGMIAYLYKMRWDIEKVFDEVKIKCAEKKSWGSSPQTKEAQAHFICMAHNLMLVCEQRMEAETGTVPTREKKRKSRRAQRQCERASENGGLLAPMYHCIQRYSQRSVIFIRWLRNHLRAQTLWEPAVAALGRHYE